MNINPIFNRYKQPEEISEVHFQALSWYAADFLNDESVNNDLLAERLDEGEKLEYVIFISGVNSSGQSVTLKVKGFTPYFYVEVPNSFTDQNSEQFFKYVKNRLWKEKYGLVDFKVTYKKKLYPYLAGKKYKFIKLIFSTDKAFYKCKWMFTQKSQEEKPIKIPGIDDCFYNAFESNINHINRFCHINEIETTGWIKVKKFYEDLEVSTSQINVTAYWKDVSNDLTTRSIAPLTIFSWDIETLPENTEEFPNPELPRDIICQISVVLAKYGSTNTQEFIFVDSPCNPIENATIYECKNEKELLEKFCEFVKLVDPDIFTGFNTWGFDDRYLWLRMQRYGIEPECFSRITQVSPKLQVKELSSSAYGNNTFTYILCPGRETFDLLVAVRREHKLDAYGLNAVAFHFLKENKVDLKYSILFKKLVGNSVDIAECAVYCIQDSRLVIRLLLFLCMIPNNIEMAKATFVPFEWLLFRGQQCKVFSLIAREARKNKYVVPVYNKTEASKKFKGATVLTAKTGLYYDPIAGLDFASLYPSIMIAFNLCYSTFIASSEMMQYVKDNNIPYHTIEWNEDIGDPDNPDYVPDSSQHSYSFVQIEDHDGKEIPNGVRGLLGIILLTLWKGRKATKKEMKTEKDQFMWAVLNGKQLAQKVTMNSIYGFTGADNGILPMKPIAASVTATGRKTIEQTSEMASEAFGATTVYGDSIIFDELITIKNDIEDVPTDISIGSFGESVPTDWKEYRGFKIGDLTINNKEFKDLETFNYLTLTHKGYQKVKKVIRHETKKKIYKITAMDDKGVLHSVRVTEGHSLINQNGRCVEAENLKIGDMLYDYKY